MSIKEEATVSLVLMVLEWDVRIDVMLSCPHILAIHSTLNTMSSPDTLIYVKHNGIAHNVTLQT